MTTRRSVLRQGVLLTVLAATGGACSGRAGPEPVPPAVNGSAGAEIDGFLTGAVPNGASLTVLAARGDEIVYCRGFGLADRTAGLAAGCDTAYDIGSITKQFTAAAIMRLAAGGELATTDPLARFFGGMPEDKRGITLHHLLTHTAGLVEQLGDDYQVMSRDDLLAGAAESALLWAPGARYRYSNLGYSLLAATVEQVSGRGYEAYLAEHLFAPAGMAQTGYRLPEWDAGKVAVEYDRYGDPHGRPYEHRWDSDGPYWNLRGNGGMLSTAEDMFRWHAALNGEGVLSGDAKAQLFEPYVLEDNGETHYGYGWVVGTDDADRTIVAHNGGNGWSFAEYFRFLDEDLMVFWATNHVERDGAWHLEDLDLAWEIVERLRTG